MSKTERTIQRVATNPIGYTKKQANKEWFDEECAKVNEEKNAARESYPKQHQRSQECVETSPDEREAFVQKKARQLNKEALIEIERHRSIQDSRKFCKHHSNHNWLCVDPRTGNY
jgi:BioD-like phosphotransacetylase family protein